MSTNRASSAMLALMRAALAGDDVAAAGILVPASQRELRALAWSCAGTLNDLLGRLVAAHGLTEDEHARALVDGREPLPFADEPEFRAEIAARITAMQARIS